MPNGKLAGLHRLDSKVSVYVPSTVHGNEAIDSTVYVEDTASALSKMFGGATSTHAVGHWQSDSLGLVREDITIVYSYCTKKQLQAHMDGVIAQCQRLKHDMKQEAVSLELDGALYFV